jgi:YesN/AraC family two-component response regulator
MDSKTLIKALKQAVREVVKEELTEILREGLQSTISEMTQPRRTTNMPAHKTQQPKRKTAVQFTDNQWASVLNETEALVESQPLVMNSFKEAMNEGMDEIRMTSANAQGFGMMRQNMQQSMGLAPVAPQIMEDPETGKTYEVAPEVQQALTRDYSALMKAMDAKKGR